MAMTQLALLFLGFLASITAYFGLFKTFADDDGWTRVLLLFASAMLWGVFGLSSYDVIVRDTGYASASEPIMPFVYLGMGAAFIVALFGVYELFQALTKSGSEAADGVMT